ncbi:hypothetical protein PYCC9005_000165 [Savitreella phatthalungensis]
MKPGLNLALALLAWTVQVEAWINRDPAWILPEDFAAGCKAPEDSTFGGVHGVEVSAVEAMQVGIDSHLWEQASVWQCDSALEMHWYKCLFDETTTKGRPHVYKLGLTVHNQPRVHRIWLSRAQLLYLNGSVAQGECKINRKYANMLDLLGTTDLLDGEAH